MKGLTEEEAEALRMCLTLDGLCTCGLEFALCDCYATHPHNQALFDSLESRGYLYTVAEESAKDTITFWLTTPQGKLALRIHDAMKIAEKTKCTT